MSDSKDTIYIDVDEEITGIVSKVQNSPKHIVALVLPKRASVLQSIVNMKLLKRAQDQHDKKVVLITSESRILPLAGMAGLFVASNLTSKPYLPPAPKMGGTKATADAGKPEEIDPNTPVSQVAPDAKFADASDEIEIDNTPKKPEPGVSKLADKPKKNNKPKVPNFSKFRKKIILIGLGVLLLIFALVYGIFIAPKAKVTVKAQTDELPLNLDFIADTNADNLDSDNKIARATTRNEQKNDSEKVDASGQKNKGEKASGSVTMTATECAPNLGQPKSVPAGTTLSYKGITYVTKSNTSFSALGTGSGNCNTYNANNSTNIAAQSPGANANVNNGSFSVSGRSDVSAQGSASGGTDKNVKVVTQSDVDKAKERLNGKPNTVHDEFVDSLKRDGYVPIEESFKAKPGDYDVSPAVGAEGDEVTVSVTITYTMLGVKEDDLKQLIKDEVAKLDEGKDKSILSEGIDSATFKLSDGGADKVGIVMDTKVIVGPDLNQDNIKQQIAGKKSGEAENILSQIPGINDPKVELSPFWVGKVPKKHSKITIEVQQADGSEIPQDEQTP